METKKGMGGESYLAIVSLLIELIGSLVSFASSHHLYIVLNLLVHFPVKNSRFRSMGKYSYLQA